MPKDTSKSDFLKSAKKYEKDWNSARHAEDEFQELDVPDGRYVGQLSRVVYGQDKNSNPYVLFRVVLHDDDDDINGQVATVGHFISDSKSGKVKAKDKLEFLARDLKRIGLDDVDDMSLSDIPDIAEQLEEANPWVGVQVKTKNDFQNVYVTRYRGGVSGESDEQQAAPADLEPEDQSDYIPKRGDVVRYNGVDCKVVKVSNLRSTVDLEDEDGEKVEKVAWDDIERQES